MKKGQAAMEYLMTYGWAILIVIVVVAALYAMGVFRIGKAPVACSPCFSTFAYIDYADGQLLVRSGSKEINLTAFTPAPSATLEYRKDGTIFTPGTTCGDCKLLPGTTLNVTGFSAGTTYSITLTYLDIDSGLSHSDTATLRA